MRCQHFAQRQQARVDKFKKALVFFDEMLVAALPFAMQAKGWTQGDKPINSIESRVNLAIDIAAMATRSRFPELKPPAAEQAEPAKAAAETKEPSDA